MFTSTSFTAGIVLLSSIAGASPIEERQANKFTYFPLKTALASPCDLTTGLDGKIYADTFTSNKIVQIDRDTGELNEYDIPYKLQPLNSSVLPSDVLGRVALSCVVQPGKNGKIYAAAGQRNEFVIFDPSTKEMTVLETGNPLGNLQPFNDAWPGETGMYFTQTTGNVINLIDYATNEITTYNVPTPLAGPLGLIVASDGGVWFTEMLANKIGRLNPSDGTFKEYPLPPSLFTPSVMRAETEGRYLWFTAIATNSIGRIDILTGSTKTFTDSRLLATPIENTVDAQGNIWYSTLTRNTLNYITPSTGEFTTIHQPATDLTGGIGGGILPSLPPAADIAIHYEGRDNSIWFTELANNRVGRYRI
ncbi:unnamed protein product [Zymoseptoria tritici ST99CH_1E4]|uniref:SMP-30/Gluconolactonase/LRE-like region domain-containing protein n=1 Tax=Zymoseptoria tritici ST99CH_1E4 TaxID=1276532 RepID=A0A2H1GF03_ZYMTR|nr:unnamed protein product [Zymoseptoria tritici ST99CH_1E4]